MTLVNESTNTINTVNNSVNNHQSSTRSWGGRIVKALCSGWMAAAVIGAFSAYKFNEMNTTYQAQFDAMNQTVSTMMTQQTIFAKQDKLHDINFSLLHECQLRATKSLLELFSLQNTYQASQWIKEYQKEELYAFINIQRGLKSRRSTFENMIISQQETVRLDQKQCQIAHELVEEKLGSCSDEACKTKVMEDSKFLSNCDEETQGKLELTQLELELTKLEPKLTEAKLKVTEAELKVTEAELKLTEAEQNKNQYLNDMFNEYVQH